MREQSSLNHRSPTWTPDFRLTSLVRHISNCLQMLGNVIITACRPDTSSSRGKKLRKGHLICQLKSRKSKHGPLKANTLGVISSWHKTVWCTLCRTIRPCPGGPCSSNSSLMEKHVYVRQSRLITCWQVGSHFNKASVSFSLMLVRLYLSCF